MSLAFGSSLGFVPAASDLRSQMIRRGSVISSSNWPVSRMVALQLRSSCMRRLRHETLARAVPARKALRFRRLGGQITGEVGDRALFRPEARSPGSARDKADV